MPSLRQRKNGVYYIDDRINGERQRPILKDTAGQPVRNGPTAKKIYDHYLAVVRPQLLHTTTPDEITGDPTLRELRDYYEREFLPARNAAPKTIAGAGKHLDTFIRFCAHKRIGRASQLSPRIIEAFSADLAKDHAAPTVKHYIATVRAMLNAAVASDVLSAHPITRWVLPRCQDPEHHPLTWPQLRDLIQRLRTNPRACPPWLFDPIYWIINTGSPPADTCALDWSQCDLETGWVIRNRVKIKALRRYPLNPEACALLRRLHAASGAPSTGPVFRNPKGHPLNANILYQHFVRAQTAVGFTRHTTLYDLRHTFATLMANARPPDVPVPLTTLQIMMGHSSITQTAYYVRAEGAQAGLQAFARQLTAPTPQTTENPGTTGHHPQKPQ